MKNFLKVVLIILITIIIVVVIIFSYVMIKNPLGIGDVLKSHIVSREESIDMTDYTDYDNPLLTDEQEKRIIETGIDINKIPTEITAEQEECGMEKIGEERLLEILNGAKPSLSEILKALSCL